MFLVIIFFMGLFLSLYGYLEWIKVKNYWKKRGVPHHPPNLIIGSLTFVQRENPLIWLRQLYRDLKAPYVGIWLAWRPALVINDPEIARRVLVKDSYNFRNHFLRSSKTDPVGSVILFTVKDPLWTAVRRRISGVFTTPKMRIHSGIIKRKTNDLVQRIREDTTKKDNFHLREILSLYTIDVIGESAFGLMSESVKTGNSVIKELADEFMTFGWLRGLDWSCIYFCPELVDIFRCSFYPKKTVQKLRLIIRSVIQQRGGYEKEVTEPKDLLDALIKMKQDAAAAGEEMTEDIILGQASLFFDGGFDTTSASLSWSLYELAWNPRYQNLIYEEVMNAKQKCGEDLTPNQLAELPFLNAVIKETLRIYPAMGWLDRVAAKDYKIDEKLTIPAGTPVYVNAAGMQVDPQYFPDPMTFTPERFLLENEEKITPFTYLPFGEGPRNCLGMRYVHNVIMHALSYLICNFEIRKVPDTPKPQDVKVEKKGVFFTPLDDRMRVSFVPRKNEK